MSKALTNVETLFPVTLTDFFPISDLPAAAGGVYALLDPDGQPLYIGQSCLITERIQQHRRTKKWWGDVDSVVAYRLANPEARLLLETLLILRYRPRRNRWIRINLRANGSLYETQFLTPSYHKKARKSNK